MRIFYAKFMNGSGRGTGCTDDTQWAHMIANNPDTAYHRLSMDEYFAIRGVAHTQRFDLVNGIVSKTNVGLKVDKPIIRPDAKDAAIATWVAPRALNFRLNGVPLANNPHEGSLQIVWDQAQRLALEVDDPEYYGRVTLVVQ